MNENRPTVWQSLWFSRIPILLVLVLTAVGTANQALAQAGAVTPFQFKMIGKFYDPEKDKNAGGVNAFTVNILKKTWIWDIESSHTLQGSALGSTVLKQIYPPIMTFMGPKELTDRLIDPAVEGKIYTLTGELYIKKRMFLLNTVEGPPEESHADAKSDSDPVSAAP